MEKLTFDSGIREYELGAGVLRFNPLDPNVYERFMDAVDQIQKLESEMVARAQGLDGNSTEALAILKETDQKSKRILNYVFGGNNDFDYMLSGVNLMAVATNGERVITNLLHALTPILESGAYACAASFAHKANG